MKPRFAIALSVNLVVLSACSSNAASNPGQQAPAGTSAGTTTLPSTAGRTASGSAGLPGSNPGGANGAGSNVPVAGVTAPAANGGSSGLLSGGMMSAGQGGAATVPSGGGNPSVLQFHNSATRDGVYTDAAFTRAAAAKLHRDKTFNAAVSGPTYAQPLYFANGPGGKDLVIVATEHNQVSAFSATDGSMVWQKTLATPAPRSALCLGNIDPLGVTGTPIIDDKSRTLYLDAMVSASGALKHMIYALSLDDGSTRAGWPVDVAATVKAGSLAFDAASQNQRGALAILNNTLYVPYGGHFGDCGNYHGWVVGVPLDNPSAPIAWASRARASGVWAPSGIASDGTSLFIATGNSMSAGGGFSAPTTWGDGEAVIRLPPTLQFSMQDADYAAAMNWQMLDSGDSDVGGSGPVLFTVPGATPSKLAVAFGKDGSSYLLDAQNLGGLGHWVSSPGKVSVEQIINAPVAYTTPSGTFLAIKGAGSSCPGGSGKKITAMKLTAASPPVLSTAWCNGPGGLGSPMVTTTGNGAETIVWYVSAESDNKLYGFNGETGEMVFGGGGADEAMTGLARFSSPIVAKGRIFVAGASAVYAFSTQ